MCCPSLRPHTSGDRGGDTMPGRPSSLRAAGNDTASLNATGQAAGPSALEQDMAQNDAAQERLVALDKAVLGEIWTSTAAYDNLRALCDTFGHRFAGSPGERGAATFLQNKLRDYGLERITAEPFRYTGWVRGPETLQVVEPLPQTLRALALPYCPAAELEADLRWAGDGEAEDYAKAGAGEGALRGCIVMTAAETSGRWGRGPSSHRRDKYMRAVEAGAAAYLYVNQNPGDLPITGGQPGGGQGPGAPPCPGPAF